MDILLATPINKTHYCVPPLGLGYLASALRKAGFSVSILDPVKENLDYDSFAEFLKKNTPRILGIQCFSFDVPSVNRMLLVAKQVAPQIITIIGGPHPSAVSRGVFDEFDNLDFALSGEGEIAFPLFVKSIFKNRNSLSSIPGLIFKGENGVMANSRELIQDIDSLDIPAWDMIDPRQYRNSVQGGFYQDLPVAPIITSRGCPYGCTFCANRILMGRGLRVRSVGKVIDEIEHLVKKYDVKEIHILDDNFAISRECVLDFCREIKKRKIKINFAFPNGIRLDRLDEEMLLNMKEIGVYSITVGIESGSQKILDDIKKELTLDLIRQKVALIKKCGFIINAFFIIGYPTEKKEDIIKTIKFAKELPIDIAHFSCFLPLPGTEITQELLDSGKLKNINYADLFYSKAPFSPEGITREEIKKFQQKAFLSFYLRPSILIAMVLRLKSIRHLDSVVRRTVDYVLLKESMKNG